MVNVKHRPIYVLRTIPCPQILIWGEEGTSSLIYAVQNNWDRYNVPVIYPNVGCKPVKKIHVTTWGPLGSIKLGDTLTR